ELHLNAAPILAELENTAEVFVRGENGGANPGLMHLLDLYRIGHVNGIMDLNPFSIGQQNLVDHRWSGGDQIEVEFALQPLLDDFQVKQPNKAAAKPEPERRAGLHLEGEARIVETTPAHGRTQILDRGGIHRE